MAVGLRLFLLPGSDRLCAKFFQVDPARFRCSFYSHEDMRRSDWRNQVLNTVGLEEFQAFNLTVPVLRVWNASSLLPGKHPQTLGHSSVADCTHWCPTMGGIFEIWSQLFFNLFAAVKRHEGVLRAPVLVDRNWAYPADSAIQRHQPAASSLDHLWNALAKWSQTSDEI